MIQKKMISFEVQGKSEKEWYYLKYRVIKEKMISFEVQGNSEKNDII